MGRWAQNRRSGGGPPVAALNQMVNVSDVTDATATVIYQTAVNGASLDAADFHTLPNAREGISILQVNPTTLEIEFDNFINDQSSIEYAGSAPNILSPQIIAI